MKKIIIYFISIILSSCVVKAQENIYPAPKQTAPFIITNATVHIGNGQVLPNASVEVKDGKIIQVGTGITAAAAEKAIDASGKQVYPGLILSVTNLGLVEVPSVRASNDLTEIGEIDPSIRSIVAYNTDSKVTNTLRPNGILLANIVPQGGLISGSSSVVQLDAWNWEDAAYKMDNAMNFYMPSLLPRPARLAAFFGTPQTDPIKEGLEKIDEIKSFFREAKAYLASPAHEETNIKFNAVKGLFDNSQKLFVHANTVKQMLLAIDFVKEFHFSVVIVGGADSWQIADLLKQNGIAVILTQPHTLPILEDDDIEQPYKTPAMLQKAGVLFAITDVDGETRGRNLAFNAGTAAAYGLTKEQALQSITINAAKILGVADKTGTLEVGKDANLFISTGDALDMRTNIITAAFIQGRQISLDNKQKQLFEKYKYKYGLK